MCAGSYRGSSGGMSIMSRKIAGHGNKATCKGCGSVFQSRNVNKYSLANDERLVSWHGDYGNIAPCPFCKHDYFKLEVI